MKKRFIELPKINEKESKKAVEKVIYQYRDYMITLPTYLMPKVTPSYSIIPPSFTNEFHSTTEDAALERLEYEEARNAFFLVINEAVNTLKEIERQIIFKSYLENDIGYDPDIWTELGVGKTKYYQIKGEAMLRLAFSLKIEVYSKTKKNEGISA
jgi:ArpU family phage transcriptional regulator